MTERRYQHKRAKRKYRKIMASLAGAAVLSSTMFAGAPVARASESIGSAAANTDILTEALLKSKEEIQNRIRMAITEKATESINAIKANPQILEEVYIKSRDALQGKLKESVNEKILEKKAELEENITGRLAPKKNNANRVLDITATAYTSGYEDNGKWGDKTHIGTKVREGIIAVDPKVIPLGSKVYIEFADGQGMYAVAEDTGGAIKGNRIDIAMVTRDKAKDFGIQDVKVHVLEEGTIA